MKWGTLYGAEYVNRLYAMVRHRTSGPLRFVCLTDDPQGVRDEVECLPCPPVDLPEPYCRTGWRKLVLWADSKDLFGLEGDWLFLDLDVVLTGPLDDFFSYRPDERFVVMQNWTQPGKGIGNTSVFRFRVGCAPFLLERMLSDFPGCCASTVSSRLSLVVKSVRSHSGPMRGASCSRFSVCRRGLSGSGRRR